MEVSAFVLGGGRQKIFQQNGGRHLPQQGQMIQLARVKGQPDEVTDELRRRALKKPMARDMSSFGKSRDVLIGLEMKRGQQGQDRRFFSLQDGRLGKIPGQKQS